MPPPRKTTEHRLIEAIKKHTGGNFIGDDCAILPGEALITVDTLVENTHFILPETSMRDLGWKTLAVNLSDIAAMSGRPRFAVISLTLPPSVDERSFNRLYGGIAECARAYRCQVVGGDLTAGKLVVTSATVLADAHESGLMRREGARAGDIIAVTGDFGASAAGLWLVKEQTGNFPYCRQRHYRPSPRLSESWSLVKITCGRGAMMDASDGLADAVIQLCTSNRTGATIRLPLVPVHNQTRAVAQLAGVDPLQWALYGGEDFELVACLRPADWQILKEQSDNPFIRIGELNDNPGSICAISARGESNRLSLENTFQHFL